MPSAECERQCREISGFVVNPPILGRNVRVVGRKREGMDDVFYRAVEMSRKLLDLSQNLNIKITDDELYTYICVEKYG